MAFDPFCSDDCFSRRSAVSTPDRVGWRDKRGLGLGSSGWIASREVEFALSPTILIAFPAFSSEAIASPSRKLCPCTWLWSVACSLGLTMVSLGCDPTSPMIGPSSSVSAALCVLVDMVCLTRGRRSIGTRSREKPRPKKHPLKLVAV